MTEEKKREKEIFSLFSPSVRQFIYSENWDGLRDIQISAAEKVFFSASDLLISSGTATGKTEAAFFPVISQMEKEEGALVLYISPVKALINDQFERLSFVLKESHIPLYHYHGDVSRKHKDDFFKNPRGILQITPESLESLLLRHWNEIPTLFYSLKWVIVDEVHALMSSDRGSQVLCLIKRIERAIKSRPRRIGLSATLSSAEQASLWLSCGETDVAVIKSSLTGKRMRIGIEHFERDEERSDFIYSATANMKSIVFSNTREEAENMTATLREIAHKKRETDRFLVHHANLSATERKEVEEKLGGNEKEVTVTATTTLEYGIDIEKLKRVISLQAPLSVSSFVQRLGRSGRRENPPEMLFALREDEDEKDIFPFELLKAIAVVELYANDKFIEEGVEKKRFSSLILHQSLAILGAEGEKTPAQLALIVLSLPPFTSYPKEEFRELIIHLIKTGVFCLTERKTLIPGVKGERMLSSYHFLSVFQDRDQYSVYDKNEKIGTVSSPPPVGESFSLAGKVWTVENTDITKKAVYVRLGKTATTSAFRGNGAVVHTKIPEKIREILLSHKEYPYLLGGAKISLEKARKKALKMDLSHKGFFSLGGGDYLLMPFVGTKIFDTIKLFFQKEISPLLPITELTSHSYHYLTFHCKENEKKIVSVIGTLLAKAKEMDLDFVLSGENLMGEKYDYLLPKSLAARDFLANKLERGKAIEVLEEIFK